MKVLVGYDGSECADLALTDLPRAGIPRRSEVLVLSVADVWPHLPVSAYETSDPAFLAEVSPTVRKAHVLARESLAEAQTLAAQGADRLQEHESQWNVRSLARAGSPVWALVTEADELKAGLLIVGSHGRSRLGRLVMGSVSQSVIQHAHCSVRVGRCGNPVRSGPVRLIVVVDGSPDSQEAVRMAAAREWPAGSEARIIVALHSALLTAIPGMMAQEAVVGAADAASPSYDEHGWLSSKAEEAVQSLRAAGIVAESMLVEGDLRQVVLGQAERWEADCIFIGASGPARLGESRIGSAASAVAARAHCSVEVIRRQIVA